MSLETHLLHNKAQPCTTPNKHTLHNHVCNLIQYFYVIGTDSNLPFIDVFYDINEVNTDYNNLQTNHNSPIKTFIPRVI